MDERYYNSKDFKKDIRDYYNRNHYILLIILTIIYIIIYTALVAAFFSINNDQFITLSIISFIGLSIIFIISFAILCRVRDITIATEFQNAVFISALKADNLLFCILRHDGSIFYADKQVKNLLNSLHNSPNHQLPTLLSHLGIETTDQHDSILRNLTNNQPIELNIKLDQEKLKMFITMLDMNNITEQYIKYHNAKDPREHQLTAKFTNSIKGFYILKISKPSQAIDNNIID